MRQATPLQVYLNAKKGREEEAIDGSQIDEVRILHQFLNKEGWMQIVANTKLSRKALMDFAHITPRDPTLMKVGSSIYDFLRRVQDSTPNNTLRRMIGIRPASEHEVTIQRHHYNVSNPTLKKYARTVVGVLQLVRRTKNAAYPFAVHGSLVKLVDSVFSQISKSGNKEFDIDDNAVLDGLSFDEDGEPTDDYFDPENDIERPIPDHPTLSSLETSILKVLELLYTLVPRTAQEVTMHSPIMQYLLLSSLRLDGAWATTSSITQKIAGAAFIGRVTFAHLITELSVKESITSHE
jgi:hypothetical protein